MLKPVMFKNLVFLFLLTFIIDNNLILVMYYSDLYVNVFINSFWSLGGAGEHRCKQTSHTGERYTDEFQQVKISPCGNNLHKEHQRSL